MNTATQAETAATPVSSQPETTPATAPATVAETKPSPAVADVDAFLFGGVPVPAPSEAASVAAPKTEETPAAPAETTPATTTEKPSGDTPQVTPVETTPTAPAESAETVATEPEKILPNRISTAQFSEIEQRAIAKRKALRDTGEDVSLKECIDIIESQDRQAHEAAGRAAEEAAATPDPLAAMEQEVTDLKTKLRAASDGSLNSAELADLQIDLAEKTADFKVAKLRREQEQTATKAVANAASETKFNESRSRALNDFPTAGDSETLLGTTLAAELAAWRSPDHPKHAALFKEDAPEQVTAAAADKAAAILAKQMGITKEQALASLRSKPAAAAPAKPATEAVATPATPPPAAGHVTTTPGTRSTPAAAPVPTAQDLLKQSRTDPKFDRDKALGFDGPALMLG